MFESSGFGKLLLMGEYLVLEGVQALSFPTVFKQTLNVSAVDGAPQILWESHDRDGKWFEEVFDLQTFEPRKNMENPSALFISSLLNKIRRLNPAFCSERKSYKILTRMDFPRNWGLGSSSTLIHNLAQWAKVNPMELCFDATNGSGYDVAQAGEKQPILYHLKAASKPKWIQLPYMPNFHNQLFFVYLGEKQDSSNEVRSFRELKKTKSLSRAIERVNGLVQDFIKTEQLSMAENILIEHENILSDILERPRIQEERFDDYNKGVIKSLGGWGGDFILATGSYEARDYFRDKGYGIIMGWEEMIRSL